MKKIQTERTHLFAPNIGVAINISISGNPSDGQIKSAIATAVSCHEALHSRIVLHSSGIAFYEKAQPNYHVYISGEKWTKHVEDFPKWLFNF